MQKDLAPTRRQAVTAGAAMTLGIAAAATMAGCGESSTNDPGGDTPPGSAGNGTSPAGMGVTLAALSDIPVGEAIGVQGPDGKAIVIAAPESGKVVAFSASCTHQHCTVKPSGAKLDCPCHGAQFDAFTGAAIKGPTSTPLASVPVTVKGNDVVAG